MRDAAPAICAADVTRSVAELRAEVAASRALPGGEQAEVVEGGSGSAKSPGAAEVAADGPMVRAVRWLEPKVEP